MKKLNVNSEACIGCGACVAIDSEHFDFDEFGLSEVISEENIESEECLNAMNSCPTNAISYIEDECCNENCNCEDDNCCENDNCSCTDCHCENCDCK